MKIKNVWIDPDSRKSASLSKPKHKLFFHIVDWNDLEQKYWIYIINCKLVFYATMNWSNTKPIRRHYHISDLSNINKSITMKPFWQLEDSPSCFWYEDEPMILASWKIWYTLSDEKFEEFVLLLTNPVECYHKIYADFKNYKVENMFDSLWWIDFFELP